VRGGRKGQCGRDCFSKLLKNPPFTWFDELTTGFDKPVLSEVEGLRANGGGIENLDDFPFMLSLSVLSGAEGSKHENPFSATSYDIKMLR
jgi:hypothetical protein